MSASQEPTRQAAAQGSGHAGGLISDALALVRYHIVGIAMVATVVFGWLMTGQRPWGIALVAGLDWFLINLLNRATDVDEDRLNSIAGTERIARARAPVTIASFGLMAASMVAVHLIYPALLPWRIAVQAIGLAYNYKVVPTPRGFSRLKEIYLLKNLGSSILFVLTCFAYPLAIGPRETGWGAIAVLVLFFVPFELTYEILYDLRDLEGDRALGVPTFPVIHGAQGARRIIDRLLAGSGLVLMTGLAAAVIGVREGLMLAAPAIQLAFYRPRLRSGLNARDCILATHLGTGLLLFYLAGTAIWLRLGMPENIFLRW